MRKLRFSPVYTASSAHMLADQEMFDGIPVTEFTDDSALWKGLNSQGPVSRLLGAPERAIHGSMQEINAGLSS